MKLMKRMGTMPSYRRRHTIALATLLLAGCTLAPHTAPDGAVQRLGGGYAQPQRVPDQTLDWGQDPARAWWHGLSSPQLDAAVAVALKQNPGLQAQLATLQQQQSLYQVSRGETLLPSVDGKLGATREKLYLGPGFVFGPLNLYNAGVSASYNLDLFGAERETLHAALARVDEQRYQAEVSRQTLISNVVTAVIHAAYTEEALQNQQKLRALQAQELDLLQAQWRAGAVPQSEVLNAQLTLQASDAALPGLRKAVAAARHQVNLLLGRDPDHATALPRLDELTLPSHVPVSLPSRLLAQRPDIEVAAAVWDESAAEVGVARADLLPQIQLTASLDAYGITPAQLFKSNSLVWGLGAGLTQPLFHGGALRAQEKAAEAAFDAAGASYRQVVAQAFSQVADVLVALAEDQHAQSVQADIEKMQQQQLALAQARYSSGSDGLRAQLQAEEQVLVAHLQWQSGQAARLSDVVALYQALGGRWETAPVTKIHLQTSQRNAR